MTQTEATAEVFITAFKALPKEEREKFIEKLLIDKEFKEDLIDTIVIEQRKKESSRSLDDYLTERENV